MLGTIIVNDSSFVANMAGSQGGAIYTFANADLALQGCSFSNNIARTGGAITFDTNRNALSIASSEFHGNAANSCGALQVLNAGSMGLAGCAFESNRALAGDGGAICVISSGVSERLCVAGKQVTATSPAGDISVSGTGPMPTTIGYNCSWNIMAARGCVVELALADIELHSFISPNNPFETVSVVDIAKVRGCLPAPHRIAYLVVQPAYYTRGKWHYASVLVVQCNLWLCNAIFLDERCLPGSHSGAGPPDAIRLLTVRMPVFSLHSQPCRSRCCVPGRDQRS